MNLSQTHSATVDPTHNVVHINSRQVTLSRIFTAASRSATRHGKFQRDWNIKFKGSVIGTIRLAHAE